MDDNDGWLIHGLPMLVNSMTGELTSIDDDGWLVHGLPMLVNDNDTG